MALENGLIVPVIRNADEKNVVGLQRSIVDLSTRARSRQLKPDEVQGGTFSITNFGSFGSVFATPVINQPQVAILGVGAVEKMPVVVDDAIAIRSIAYLALTFDHRLIDGALADQFTAKGEIDSRELVRRSFVTSDEIFLKFSADKLEQLHGRIQDCLGASDARADLDAQFRKRERGRQSGAASFRERAPVDWFGRGWPARPSRARCRV